MLKLGLCVSKGALIAIPALASLQISAPQAHQSQGTGSHTQMGAVSERQWTISAFCKQKNRLSLRYRCQRSAVTPAQRCTLWSCASALKAVQTFLGACQFQVSPSSLPLHLYLQSVLKVYTHETAPTG